MHHAEMRHRHVVPVHFVVMHVLLPAGIEVRDDLVAEEIEVHPLVAAAPFGAAEQFAVETARRGRSWTGWRGETVAASNQDELATTCSRMTATQSARVHFSTMVYSLALLAHHSSRARTARSG